MSLQYRLLFKLLLQHDYFPEEECSVIDIVPSSSTMRVMNALDLRHVQRDSGVELFYGERAASGAPLLELEGALRLSFWLRPTDPLFFNYTDLPLTKVPGFVYHASNLEDGSTFGFPAAGVKHLPLRSSHLQVTAEKVDTSVVLTDELDHLIQSTDDALADGPEFRLAEDGLTANLSLLPAGEYRISGAGAPEVFVPATDGYQQGDLGLLTIYVGDLAGRGTRMLANGTVSPGEYTIAFGARATRWRYHLIGEGFHNFSIVGEDFPVSAPPKQRVLPNGGVATVLASQRPLHLRQRPQIRLQLHADGTDDRPAIAPMPLPAASADRIIPDPEATDGEAFFSDIYVYL